MAMNLFRAYETILRGIMGLAGLRPQKVEIKPGTVVNTWAPTKTAEKPPVVLLHGFAADRMLTWQFQALSLAGKYSVYVPDLVFFGSSTTDRPDRSMALQAQCVARALERLGVDRCVLVGFAYGGMVGFELAQAFPELVEALVITSSVMTLTESISDDCFRRIGDGATVSRWSDFLLPDSTEGVRLLFEFGTHKLPPWIPHCIFRQYLEVMFDHRKEKAELLEAVVVPDNKDPDITPSISQVVQCELFNVAAGCRKLGDRATVEHIERAGHLVMLERPFAYNRRLKKILASFCRS